MHSPVTSLMLKRELEDVKRELRNLKTGQHENKRENTTGEMTADEKVAQVRTGRATYGPRCETCLNVRGVSTNPRNAVAEAAYIDHAAVKNCQQGAEVKILVSAGPRGDKFAWLSTHDGTCHLHERCSRNNEFSGDCLQSWRQLKGCHGT